MTKSYPLNLTAIKKRLANGESEQAVADSLGISVDQLTNSMAILSAAKEQAGQADEFLNGDVEEDAVSAVANETRVADLVRAAQDSRVSKDAIFAIACVAEGRADKEISGDVLAEIARNIENGTFDKDTVVLMVRAAAVLRAMEEKKQ